MLFKQHVPGFVDANAYEFTPKDTAELLAHERIARLRKERGFYRFSQTGCEGSEYPDAKYQSTLMLEERYGSFWWVLGYASEKLDLPEWKYPGKRNRRLLKYLFWATHPIYYVRCLYRTLKDAVQDKCKPNWSCYFQ